MSNRRERPARVRGTSLLFSPWGLIALFVLIAAGLYLGSRLTQRAGDGPNPTGIELGALDKPLSSTPLVLVPGSTGIGNPPGAVQLKYDLPQRAVVTARLEGPVSSDLLTEEQDAGEHTLRFNGVISGSKSLDGYMLVRQVVPDGQYSLRILAGEAPLASMNVTVQQADTSLPTLRNIVVKPEVVSPNSDAVDDVAEVTFRMEETATLSVDLTDGKGSVTPMLAPVEKGPREQSAVVNAQDLVGEPLPNGVYTATIRAKDRAGNRVEAYRPLMIEGSGEASIEILKVEISPQQIIGGQAISVSITVRNNGDVPLRTQGPDFGYSYTTNDTYASVEG
ncbi:MAG TPA: hypothetical protein VM409_03390, partial [Chloroflexia bacterium]|nr:hypothetical protein [Chloroflexia bacterium]